MSSTSATSSPATLEGLASAVQARNPFTDNRVNGPSPDDVDVVDLNRAGFERLTALAAEALATRRGLGAVVWGDAGIGKSHLLSRLARWAQTDDRAYLVYLHNLQAGPANLPRAVLRSVMATLNPRRGRSYLGSPLHTLMRRALKTRVPEGMQTWAVFQNALAGILMTGPADAAMNDPVVPGIFYQFFRSVERHAQNKEDGSTAEIAARWLTGDALTAAQAAQLGLAPARDPEQPVALEDNQQVKQVLVCLTRLAAAVDRPFVLCFDQVDNLDTEQFAALARFLEALIDSAGNLLVVTATIKSTMLDWMQRRVIQESAKDRLRQFEIDLQRANPERLRPIVERRVQHFLAPFAGLAAVRGLATDDTLFPLGGRWFEKKMQGRLDIRPRDVVNDAGEQWQHEQRELARLGISQWLTSWHDRQAGKVVEVKAEPWTEAKWQQELDAVVACKVNEHRLASPPRLPDEESLAESLYQLAEQCRTFPAHGFTVERVEPPDYGPQPPYHLLLTHRLADGREVTTGVIVRHQSNASEMVWVLSKVREDGDVPHRVLLVTHEHGPALGERGEEHLLALQGSDACEFKVLDLPATEFLTIDALHATWLLARSEDLEVNQPGGESRLVAPEEVLASLRRQRLLDQSALLAEIFRAPSSPAARPAPGAEPATDLPDTFEEDSLDLGALGVGNAVVEEVAPAVAAAEEEVVEVDDVVVEDVVVVEDSPPAADTLPADLEEFLFEDEKK